MKKLISTNEVKDLLLPIFKKYDINNAFLFGSVAKGTNNESSDLDILVDSSLKGLRFIGFLEEIRNAVNMDVDLLDVKHIEKGSMVEKEIEKTGVLIYAK